MNAPARYRMEACRTADGGECWELLGPDGAPLEQARRFLQTVDLRGLAPRTLRTYAYDLLAIYRWLDQTGRDPARLDEQDLLEFIRFQRDRKPRPAATTINRRACTLERFVACLQGRRLDLWPGAGPQRRRRRRTLPRVKEPRKTIRPLTHAELVGFIDGLKTLRDRCIVALMWACGLRAAEVLALRVCDVRFDQLCLWINGKGDKQRSVPMPEELARLLERYIQNERPAHSATALFVVLKGPGRARPLSYAGLRRIFRYHRRISGIPQANPHRFRHTFAANMAKNGVTLPVLMRLLGHNWAKTTLRYIHLDDREVREQYRRAFDAISTVFDAKPPA